MILGLGAHTVLHDSVINYVITYLSHGHRVIFLDLGTPMKNGKKLPCIVSKNVKFELEKLLKLNPKTRHDILRRFNRGLSRD